MSVNVIKCMLRYTLKLIRMHCSSNIVQALHSPLQRYLRLDQMMFSCEKQNTPRRPPLILVSITTPESATMSVPSYNFTLCQNRETPQTCCFLASKSSKVWIVLYLRHLTWCIPLGVCASDSSGRTPCPSSPHYEGLSTASALDCLCLQCATENSSGTPLARF